MTFSHALLAIALCVLAGSYTWGMRGTILGGERGAMLPGALLALVMLFAGGETQMCIAYPMVAVIGATGMFFGGSQTYGETIEQTFDEKKDTRWFARFGLAVKGAGWFGVFGGVFAFGLGALTGRFVLWQVILFVSLLPLVKWLGVLAFNYPQKPKENRFPKIYFSKSRFEVWGGLLLLCIYFCIFGCIVQEWLMPLMTAFGMVFGALGFWLGNLFQTALDGDRETRLFSWLRKTGVLSGWKGMECIFGAVGGLGMGIARCLFHSIFITRMNRRIIAYDGVWSAFADKTNNILLFVWLFLFALFVLRYAVQRDSCKFADILYRYEDILIYPVFCYIPLFLASCGNTAFAAVFSISGMAYLLAEKIAFSGAQHFETMKFAKPFQIVCVALSAILLALQLFTRIHFSAFSTFALYILMFILVYGYIQIISAFFDADGTKSIRPSLGWTAWACICTLALLVPGWFYFTNT